MQISFGSKTRPICSGPAIVGEGRAASGKVTVINGAIWLYASVPRHCNRRLLMVEYWHFAASFYHRRFYARWYVRRLLILKMVHLNRPLLLRPYTWERVCCQPKSIW